MRLTPLTPDALDEGSRKLYDAVLASPRAEGPGRRARLSNKVHTSRLAGFFARM